MTTPQQFLESLFREKVAVYAEANVRLEPIYARHFGEPLSRRTRDFLLQENVVEFIDEVKESAGSTIVITSIKNERYPTAVIRTRYQLVVVGGDRKITRIDRECLYCRGTDKSGNEVCQNCGGEGWIEHG